MNNQDRDDVMYGFAVTYDRTPEFLNRYRAEFPQYADDLTELAAELDKPEEYDDQPLTAEQEARIAREVEKFQAKLEQIREAKRKQLNEYDLHNLRHMLGMNWTPKKDHGYRNRFCAARGEQLDSMRKMESLGFVVERGGDGDFFSFYATRSGCKAVGLNPKGIERAMEGKE